MGRRRQYTFFLTRSQTSYLHELIEDDLAETDLTDQERSIAGGLLRSLDRLRDRFRNEDESASREGST